MPDEGSPWAGGLLLCPTVAENGWKARFCEEIRGGHMDHDVFSGHMYTTYLLLFRIPQVRSKDGSRFPQRPAPVFFIPVYFFTLQKKSGFERFSVTYDD